MKREQRVWGEIKHTYLYFSPYRKIHFSRENCVRGTKSGARKLTTFANCSKAASPILIVEGSVYNRNILCFMPAEDIDQIKLAFTYRGLKHTGVASDGCNRLRSVLFVDAPDLGAVLLKNDATDFGMWDEE